MPGYESNCRYSVENIPLYDSAEDEPTSRLQKTLDSTHFGLGQITDSRIDFSISPNFGEGWKDADSHALAVHQQIPIPIQGLASDSVKTETSEEKNLFSRDPRNVLPPQNSIISQIKSNACRVPGIVPKKRSKNFPNGKPKSLPLKQIDPKLFAQQFACRKAQDELLNCEVIIRYEIYNHCFHLTR